MSDAGDGSGEAVGNATDAGGEVTSLSALKGDSARRQAIGAKHVKASNSHRNEPHSAHSFLRAAPLPGSEFSFVSSRSRPCFT